MAVLVSINDKIADVDARHATSPSSRARAGARARDYGGHAARAAACACADEAPSSRSLALALADECHDDANPDGEAASGPWGRAATRVSINPGVASAGAGAASVMCSLRRRRTPRRPSPRPRRPPGRRADGQVASVVALALDARGQRAGTGEPT